MQVQVALTWKSTTEKDLAGYKIYWGASSLSSILRVEKDVTSVVVVTPVQPLVLYRFLISSYDTAGNESEKRLLTTVFVTG